jgi:hypothetical protein
MTTTEWETYASKLTSEGFRELDRVQWALNDLLEEEVFRLIKRGQTGGIAEVQQGWAKLLPNLKYPEKKENNDD